MISDVNLRIWSLSLMVTWRSLIQVRRNKLLITSLLNNLSFLTLRHWFHLGATNTEWIGYLVSRAIPLVVWVCVHAALILPCITPWSTVICGIRELRVTLLVCQCIVQKLWRLLLIVKKTNGIHKLPWVTKVLIVSMLFFYRPCLQLIRSYYNMINSYSSSS